MAGERKFVKDNVKRALLKEYLKEQVKRAGFGGVDIQRTPMGTRVTLVTERPGLVIGRKGSSIKALTDAIEFEFGFDKPQVEVVEVDNPNLSAQIMAEKLASALERGWHFRRAGHSTVRRIMDAGARGCQVIISGKLTGQRHRTEKFKEGHIKFCGEPKLQWMEEGYTPAKLKPGIIGVKVQIMHPEAKLPDEVTITLAEHLRMDDRPVPAKKESVGEEAPKEGPEGEVEGNGKPEKAKTPQEKPVKKTPPEEKAKDEKPKRTEEPEPGVGKKDEAKPEGDEKAEKPKEEKGPETEKPEPKGTKEPEPKPEKPVDEGKPDKKAARSEPKAAPADNKKEKPEGKKKPEPGPKDSKASESKTVKEKEEKKDGTSEAE